MPNAWFRMYAEFADDPKVQMMPEVMQRRLAMLFCLRCLGKPIETFRETEIAFKWRISLQDLAETKSIFLENGFIDEKWNVLNWNKRQYLSDSSTERVRKHRQLLKQCETLPPQEQTVSVTAPEQNRTEQKESSGHPVPLFPDINQEPVADLEKIDSKPEIWIRLWNENRGTLPEIRKITSDIKKEISSRAKEYSDDEFIEAVQMCATLPFLRGENDRKWKATLGWLLRGKTSKNDGVIIGQVLNGKYGERPQAPPQYDIVEVSPQEFWKDTGIHVS